MAEPDLTLLRGRASNEANRLVIDFGAFGDAQMIANIADLVDRSHYTEAPQFRAMVSAELRTRAAVIAGLPG